MHSLKFLKSLRTWGRSLFFSAILERFFKYWTSLNMSIQPSKPTSVQPAKLNAVQPTKWNSMQANSPQSAGIAKTSVTHPAPVQVEIINRSGFALPRYATLGSAGVDLPAYLPEGPRVIQPHQRVLIPTRLYMALPQGFEAQIRPRSGLAYKHGITVLNTPGT